MRNFLVCLIVLLATGMAAQAQSVEYKPFMLGFGLGYASPSDGGGGILVDLEPAYRINDAIAVGLRIESAAMARAIGDEEASISGNGSYTLNGRYYFSNSTFRPYAGLGVGIFALASVSVNTTSGSVAAETKLGFYPRVGFDLGHFNLNLDYNIIPASEAITVDNNGNVSTDKVDIKNSYLGIRFGFFVFGGKQ